jgi:hypothetical protein
LRKKRNIIQFATLKLLLRLGDILPILDTESDSIPRMQVSGGGVHFETIKSTDVVVPVKRGDLEAKVRLRTLAKLEEDAAVLFSHSGLRLQSRSKTEQNVMEKNG